MQNNFHINDPWLSPSQYVAGRVHVAVEHKAATTTMNTAPAFLAYWLMLTTTHTLDN